MCTPKRRFYDELRKLLESEAKGDVDPDRVIIMDLLTRISNSLRQTNCTFKSRELWKKALEMLEKVKESNDIVVKKAYLEKLAELVKVLNDVEARWNNRVITLLILAAGLALLLKPLNLLSYVPWISLILYQLSPSLSLLVLFAGGVLSFFVNPVLGVPYVIISVLGGIEPPIKVDLEVKVRRVKVSEEDVKRLFIEYYGEREGEELFKFELYQLIVSGKTKEEALAELWERLTSTKIPSEGEKVGGEHVVLRRKDQGAENNNEARNNS